jgi:hypothetical protein
MLMMTLMALLTVLKSFLVDLKSYRKGERVSMVVGAGLE